MLYKLNKDNRKEYEKVKRVTLAEIGWREKDLEDLISNNIIVFPIYYGLYCILIYTICYN